VQSVSLISSQLVGCVSDKGKGAQCSPDVSVSGWPLKCSCGQTCL